MSFTFKHPKYYKELRARNKSDQAISDECATAPRERSPGPGLKQRDSQVVNQVKLSSQSQASGLKLQATSTKPQASSVKHQAQKKTSHKPQALRCKLQA